MMKRAGGWLDNLAQLLPAQREAEERRAKQKELADRYVAAGQTKMAQYRYASAIASYNCALSLQREALGEDHVVAGHTLLEIGMCFAHLEEDEAAMVALKEALYIILNAYGPDADETQETKAVIAELIHDDIRKNRLRPQRLSVGTSGDESSTFHDSSSNWEYDFAADTSTPISQKQFRRRNSDEAAGQSLRQNAKKDDDDEQSRRRKSDQDGCLSDLDDSNLHDDFHYREYFRQDSGSKFSIPLGGSLHIKPSRSSDSMDQQGTNYCGKYGNGVDSPSLTIPNDIEETEQEEAGPQLSKEERAARNAAVLDAVDDIEKSIMSSLNFGPEGGVEITSKDKATRLASLKAVDL